MNRNDAEQEEGRGKREEGMGGCGWRAGVKELQGEIKMSRVYEEVKEKEGKYGATS